MAYNRELELLNALYDVCSTASSNEAWTTEARTDARGLISDPLVVDREAMLDEDPSLLEGGRPPKTGAMDNKLTRAFEAREGRQVPQTGPWSLSAERMSQWR